MNDERGVIAIVVTGLAVLCCAGPAVVAWIVSDSALVGDAVAFAAVIALVVHGTAWVHRRNRSADPNAADCGAVDGVTGKEYR